jgi:cell division protease FtsH
MYQDVWDILSDGFLSGDSDKDYMLEMLYDARRGSKKKKDQNACEETGLRGEDPFGEDYLGEDYWSVKRFKDVLKLDEPLEEIALWDRSKRISVVKKRFNEKLVYKDDDYTKLLIFISGNLDEAFKMAEGVDDVNLDADIYHDYSKKISMIDIKNALKERFKPEQIARFGNIHIIYPSLSKASYESIIAREIDKISLRLKKEFEITVKIDNSINELIYANGVFPVQGVRPVFSTISEMLESNIPTFALHALINKVKSFKISYQDQKIVTEINKKKYEIELVGQIDSIKEKRRKNKDFITMLAVHEAGHALNYAVEFGTAPVQIAIDVASSQEGADAFVGCHENGATKNFLKKHIIVSLGGLEAEKYIFGDGGRGAGVSNDLLQATATAGEMIRNYGMGNTKTFIVPTDSQHADACNTDIESTNKDIDKLVEKMSKKSRKNIKNNLLLFYDIVDRLIAKGQMMPGEFQEICKNNDMNICVKDNDETLDMSYSEIYEGFSREVD